jgi:hypothetical protein
MNQDPKDDIPKRNPSRGWLALIALLALGFSAAAYSEVHRNMTAGVTDEAMLTQLNQVAHLHVMLGQMGYGRLEAVRHQLKLRLAEERTAIEPLVATAGDQPARYARTILDYLDRDQKAHPDYYAPAYPTLAPDNKAPAVPAERQVAASALTTH